MKKYPNYWKIKRIRANIDTDNDRVPDWLDCKPFDKTKQHPKEEKLRMAISMIINDPDASPEERREDLMDMRGICQGLGLQDLVDMIDNAL